MSTTVEDPVVATNPTTGRARRKSAKAAAAFVAEAIKEEMSIPDEPSHTKSTSHKLKRTISRGNSHGSAISHASISNRESNRGAARAAANKKKTALSAYAVEYLKAWMMSPDHIEHPYPSEDEKVMIMKDTGIELKQLTNWFVNNRKRYWKPKVEEFKRQMVGAHAHSSLQEMAAAAQAATNGSVTSISAIARKNSMVVSSEDESHSPSTTTATYVRKTSTPASSNKKRKKYSTLNQDPVEPPASSAKGTRATLPRSAKKAKEDKKKEEEEPTQAIYSLVANPIGIHTANTHASVKLARKMSHDSTSSPGGILGASQKGKGGGKILRKVSHRVVSETSSSETESDEDVPLFIKPGSVSNPLDAVVSIPTSTSSANIDVIVNDPIITATEEASPDAAPQTEGDTVANQVAADLDYSITPLDEEVLAVADSNVATAVAAGFCMPHSCNTNPDGQPCALCSACRDWNLGQFCPWDLTGIIGDISNDVEVSKPPAKDDEDVPMTTLAKATSSGTLDGSGSHHEEATTITKNSTVTGADLASIDDNIEPNAIDCKGSVPQEISHSTSSADFMNDIETWD